MVLRRKTLFYMVSLIVPSASMAFLTILVFLLSSNSGEKITLSISIMLALTLFFLLLLDIMPPTSLVVPLLSQYLVFTITMLSTSIFFTISILNIHHRSPKLHSGMPQAIRELFLKRLPKYLFFKDLLQEYQKFISQTSLKNKCQLLLKSSEHTIASLEKVYHNNMILTQKGYRSVRRKRPNIKNYFGSNLLLVVEDSATQPLCNTKESRQIHRSRPKGELRTRNHLNNLIVENINYLRAITDRLRKDYIIKNVIYK